MRWQPIETAPKDGAAVIGFDPGRESEWMLGIEFMRWYDGAWHDPATHRCRPTHWMPLPEPPSASAIDQAADPVRERVKALLLYAEEVEQWHEKWLKLEEENAGLKARLENARYGAEASRQYNRRVLFTEASRKK